MGARAYLGPLRTTVGIAIGIVGSIYGVVAPPDCRMGPSKNQNFVSEDRFPVLRWARETYDRVRGRR